MTIGEFIRGLDIYPKLKYGVRYYDPSLSDQELKAAEIGVRIIDDVMRNGPDSTYSLTEERSAEIKDVSDETWAVYLMTRLTRNGIDLDISSYQYSPTVSDDGPCPFDYHIWECNKKPLSYYFQDYPEEYNQVDIKWSKETRSSEIQEVFRDRQITYLVDPDIPEGEIIITIRRV